MRWMQLMQIAVNRKVWNSVNMPISIVHHLEELHTDNVIGDKERRMRHMPGKTQPLHMNVFYSF